MSLEVVSIAGELLWADIPMRQGSFLKGNVMNIIKFDEMVTLNGNRVMTTSLKVAEYFGKRHSDVLRAINNLECSDDFNERNFALAHYIDEQSKSREMFNITRDGCMFLIMGFTGKLAAKIKETYINAFNWIAEQLQNKQNSYMRQYNDLLLVHRTEEQIASQSGRLLRDWGRNKKPNLINKIERLENKLQLDWVN